LLPVPPYVRAAGIDVTAPYHEQNKADDRGNKQNQEDEDVRPRCSAIDHGGAIIPGPGGGFKSLELYGQCRLR
jgi:hypothetical protein